MLYRARFVVFVLGLAGCQSVSNVAVFGGGIATGAVVAKEKGNAILSVGGGAHAGSRDVPTMTSTETDRSAGVSIYSEGVGVASEDGIGVAAHSRMQLGVFGDDYFFGEIDFEVGAGFLRHGQVGGGMVAGWNYGGQFDASHSLPVRAIAYWSSGDVVLHGSAHISYRADSEAWDGRGGEIGGAIGKVGFGLRYEDQNGADVLSATFGWALHTVEGSAKPR